MKIGLKSPNGCGGGFTVSPKAILVIDLEQSMDELFANLKKDARNKVRKAEKQGVEIVELGTDETSLQQLQQVMAETSRRNGLPALSPGSSRILSGVDSIRLY